MIDASCNNEIWRKVEDLVEMAGRGGEPAFGGVDLEPARKWLGVGNDLVLIGLKEERTTFDDFGLNYLIFIPSFTVLVVIRCN